MRRCAGRRPVVAPTNIFTLEYYFLYSSFGKRPSPHSRYTAEENLIVSMKRHHDHNRAGNKVVMYAATLIAAAAICPTAQR